MSLTRLARRKSFQCLHRYAVADWTLERNTAEFGACFTPHGHGHNYELEAFFEGPIDPVSGMIANLVDIDALLGELLAPLNGKHLNEEVPEFKNAVPTTEAIAGYLAAKLIKLNKLSGVRIVKLRLFEYEDLLGGHMALMATTRRYSFRAVHSLDAGIHSEKFHGHQYFVEVSFERAPVADVDQMVEEKILRVLDRHDLTKHIRPATGEMIVEWIQRELDFTPLRAKILGVALQETRKNRFVSGRSVPQLI